jgi:hypothetical protein
MQLQLLYDGASQAARMDKDLGAAAHSRIAAADLLEKATTNSPYTNSP